MRRVHRKRDRQMWPGATSVPGGGPVGRSPKKPVVRYYHFMLVRPAKYMTFQMAEVTVPREMFAAILDRIRGFGVPPPLVQRE